MRASAGSQPFADAAGVHHPAATGESRIVSLVPSLTELLFAMALGPQVVGRTRYCVHPRDQVERVTEVGGTKRLRIPVIEALRPTHIIANIEENSKADVEALGRFVPNVVLTYPRRPRDNLGLYRLIGSIFARGEQAERLCLDFERRYSVLRQRRSVRPPRTVLYLIWRKPWMSVSTHTYIGRMLALINWHTPFAEPANRYPTVEPGEICVEQIDKVLFSSEPFPFTHQHIREFAERFGVPPAKLLQVDGELLSWYGSRALAGLDYLGTLDYE